MSCFDEEAHAAACEAYREIEETGECPALIAAIEALVLSTVTRQSKGVELEVAAHLRESRVTCSRLRELLQERGRL